MSDESAGSQNLKFPEFATTSIGTTYRIKPIIRTISCYYFSSKSKYFNIPNVAFHGNILLHFRYTCNNLQEKTFARKLELEHYYCNNSTLLFLLNIKGFQDSNVKFHGNILHHFKYTCYNFIAT